MKISNHSWLTPGRKDGNHFQNTISRIGTHIAYPRNINPGLFEHWLSNFVSVLGPFELLASSSDKLALRWIIGDGEIAISKLKYMKHWACIQVNLIIKMKLLELLNSVKTSWRSCIIFWSTSLYMCNVLFRNRDLDNHSTKGDEPAPKLIIVSLQVFAFFLMNPSYFLRND